MAIIIREKKVKCFQCNTILYARVKVDSKTGNIMKYINVGGGRRIAAQSGLISTYCDFCAKLLEDEREKAKTFFKGERIKYLKKPEWGVGQVLKDSSSDSMRVYFVRIGEKKVLLQYGNLVRVQGEEANQPLLDILNGICCNRDDKFNVYVIELKQDVMNNHKFREANQACDLSYPCVYVGLTGLTPRERFDNHKIGHKSSYYPHKFCERLLPDLYECFNPMSYEDAKKMEFKLADALRLQGYAVWQN